MEPMRHFGRKFLTMGILVQFTHPASSHLCSLMSTPVQHKLFTHRAMLVWKRGHNAFSSGEKVKKKVWTEAAASICRERRDDGSQRVKSSTAWGCLSVYLDDDTVQSHRYNQSDGDYSKY